MQGVAIFAWRGQGYEHGRTDAATHRVAITEWENLDKARAFFKSKGWADAKPDRDKALKPYADMR